MLWITGRHMQFSFRQEQYRVNRGIQIRPNLKQNPRSEPKYYINPQSAVLIRPEIRV
jgi:hypothetical protein